MKHYPIEDCELPEWLQRIAEDAEHEAVRREREQRLQAHQRDQRAAARLDALLILTLLFAICAVVTGAWSGWY
jgi:uncharacterized membrane protein